MGLFTRRDSGRTGSLARGTLQGVRSGQFVWLPGGCEVQVAGESFHEDAIRAAESSSPGSPLAAVIVPEPDNAHDPNAVAVYVNGQHVGYLPRETARRAQPAIAAFIDAHDGRLPSCPAEIRWHDVGPQVVLLLDPAPLSLPPEAFAAAPDLAATIMRLLPRLDEPPRTRTGSDPQAWLTLATLDARRTDIDASHDGRLGGLRQAEHAFRDVADRLAAVGDPAASGAFLSLARTTRYQSGRRDDTLSALIEALYCDRGNDQAWAELLDYASAAPRVPMLLALFGRVPAQSKPAVLRQLLAASQGQDRLGRLHPAAGALLRHELLAAAEAQPDKATIATLTGYAGLAAEKAGDLGSAVGYWRRAVAAGSTDEKVADRLSVWLTGRHEYPEAAAVLRQALAANPHSATTAGRIRRRLERCERARVPAPPAATRRTPPHMPADLESLVCEECGQAFQRNRARGRKPLRCPGCSGKQVVTP